MTRSDRSSSGLDATYRGYVETSERRWTLDNPGNRANFEELRVVSTNMCAGAASRDALVLDVGSGAIGSFPWLFEQGRRVRCDLLEWRLRLAPEVDRSPAVCADGAALPVRDDAVDVAFLSTVLSSVDTTIAAAILDEVRRVMRPGGYLVIYDLRWPNPMNRAVRPIRRRWIRKYLSGFDVTVRSVTVVPQLARRLGRFSTFLMPRLARLSFVRSHNIVVARRSGAS